ncbi:unnamed protein product [Closterium sp. Yama58-4]|nr:unnamed protein product [Closterium sp. Yama58-4]
MDKVATGQAISHVSHDSRKGRVHSAGAADATWQRLIGELQADSFCVKPATDGCSAGVARLATPSDLAAYIAAVRDAAPRLLPGQLSTLCGIVEMPVRPPTHLLFEPFIETDPIRPLATAQQQQNQQQQQEEEEEAEGTCDNNEGLVWEGRRRWVEVTVGVVGHRGRMRALAPSVTVKEAGDVLTLEEKFQGGTGINLTPPPTSIIGARAQKEGKRRIEMVANALNIDGFARIDAFMHADTGEVIVIEANTVPGMTPSTVLMHQALAESPPIRPRDFFAMAVEHAIERHTNSDV